MTQELIERVARAMRHAMTAVDYGGEGSEGVAFIDIEAGARAAIEACDQSQSARIAELEGVAQAAYEEGVEDGIGWHCYPESGSRPQWIDSDARNSLTKDSTSG